MVEKNIAKNKSRIGFAVDYIKKIFIRNYQLTVLPRWLM
jgi:hypothetical protein